MGWNRGNCFVVEKQKVALSGNSLEQSGNGACRVEGTSWETVLRRHLSAAGFLLMNDFDGGVLCVSAISSSGTIVDKITTCPFVLATIG